MRSHDEVRDAVPERRVVVPATCGGEVRDEGGLERRGVVSRQADVEAGEGRQAVCVGELREESIYVSVGKIVSEYFRSGRGGCAPSER